MGFGQASGRGSICIERLLRSGGGDAQVRTLGSLRHSHWVRWRARGRYRCPLGKVQGSSAADPGNPSKCSRSQSLIPARKAAVTALHPPVSGMLCLWHPALVFIFQTCHCFHIVMTGFLNPSLLSLRFGGNWVSGCPSLLGHCVTLLICHSSLWAVLILSQCCGKLVRTCAHTCTYTISHLPQVFKNYNKKQFMSPVGMSCS